MSAAMIALDPQAPTFFAALDRERRTGRDSRLPSVEESLNASVVWITEPDDALLTLLPPTVRRGRESCWLCNDLPPSSVRLGGRGIESLLAVRCEANGESVWLLAYNRPGGFHPRHAQWLLANRPEHPHA